MSKHMKMKRLMGMILCGVMTVSMAISSFADTDVAAGTVNPPAGISAEAGSPAGSSSGAETGGLTENVSGGSTAPENSPSDNGAAENTIPPNVPVENNAPNRTAGTGSGNTQVLGNDLTMDGYDLFEAGSSKKSLDTLRKGQHGKAVVYVKSSTLLTNDVDKNEITVSKIKDSFRSSSNPKVRVTSRRDENLEFTVTFSNLTYLGQDNQLKFKVRYKTAAGQVSEEMEVNISECDESRTSGIGDGDEGIGQPVIRIDRVGFQTPVSPGEKFTLTLRLENTSNDSDIEDLVLNVNPGTSLHLLEKTNTTIIKRLDTKKSTEVKLEMQAGQDLGGVSQNLDLELKYGYYVGNRLVTATANQKVMIPVRGSTAPGQPLLRISRSEIGKVISAGESFGITLRIENLSKDKDISNLIASLEPNDQISLLESTDSKIIGELKAGQVAEIPIRLQAGGELSKAASQLLGVTLKFDYISDKGGTQGTYSEKVVIPTNGGSGSIGGPTPNIIIKNYTYGEQVSAGEVFELEMELANTSSMYGVENLVMSLDTGEGLSINSSSNTIFIPKLEAGETQKYQVKVQALFQSKLQSPKISISCKYEYVDKKERKQTTSSETIAIPVYQPDRFEVKAPNITEAAKVNEETTISLPYVNKGRGQVFNAEARLDGDIQALEKELTLGNYEAGKSGTIDFVVTPQKVGTFQGKVVVSYEDEAMKAKTLEIPVEFQVQEAAAPQEGNMESEFPEQNKSKKWILWGVGLVIAAVGFMIGKKKIKNRGQKKETELLEDMDGWDDDEEMDDEEIADEE